MIPLIYTEPIIINNDTTIKFIAVAKGNHVSKQGEEHYILNPLLTEFELLNDFTLDNQYVTITKLNGVRIDEWMVNRNSSTPEINNALWSITKPVTAAFDDILYGDFKVLASEFKDLLNSEKLDLLLAESQNSMFTNVTAIITEIGKEIITEDDSYIIKEIP